MEVFQGTKNEFETAMIIEPSVFEPFKFYCSVYWVIKPQLDNNNKMYLPFTKFSYIRNRVCSIYSGTGKFCLAHGLRQLTHTFNIDVRSLNFRSDVTFALPRKTLNDVRKRSSCDVKCQKMKEMTDNI